ncbi:MAG: recombinase family protein [Clostridia bacterium]|nr:recombinase family protein [Clostridia bacterium]
MINAVGYTRYSTDKQTENSTQYQINAIKEYAQKNNINILRYYSDEGYSGTNIDRPAFQELLNAAQHKLFEAVIIYDISRASRDVADWMTFRKHMEALNIRVISATQNLGSALDPDSYLVELINAGIGQHMVLQSRQKSIAGVANKAKKGIFLGGYPPLGYRIENGAYAIDESEAAHVRTIFKMYSDGDSYEDILIALKGLRGKRGAVIGKNSLNSILKNERYIGVYTWNKHKYKIMRKWAGGKLNPNVVRIEGIIPPIIDKITWERVQRRMADNKGKARNKAKREYLLSGLIECEKCGATFVGHTAKKNGHEYVSYICGNKYRTRACDAHNIKAEVIESFVVAQLKQYFKTTDFEAVADNICKAVNDASADLSKEKKELNDINVKIENGVKAVLSGMNIPELEQELDRLRVRKSELEDIINRNESSKKTISKKKLVALMKDAAENIDKNIKTVIRNHVTKIYAHADGTFTVNIGVHINYCGDRI